MVQTLSQFVHPDLNYDHVHRVGITFQPTPNKHYHMGGNTYDNWTASYCQFQNRSGTVEIQ